MNSMSASRRFAPLLWLLTGVFTFRVFAQFMLLSGDILWLPSYEHWHSGTMPYEYLFLSQLLILWMLVTQSVKFTRGEIQANKQLGRVLWWLGMAYFASMLFRLLLGLTVMTESRWFTNYIPIFFHFVLAGYVLLVAAFYQQRRLPIIEKVNRFGMTILARSIYPLVIVVGLYAHYVMAYIWDFNVALAAYISIVMCGLAITLLEYALPYKKKWWPNRADLKSDAIYMGLVQVVLPKIVTPVFIVLIVAPIQYISLSPATLWPHQLPVWLQAILMILTADFLRYWLHRIAHSNPYLWRLHAVHHSPDKLYWFNVARFHPMEKMIQMLFDVLPFVLLGVSEYVISLYIVFYSINGFFQHCNIRLEFGWLNYLISSAQLHRWHHSKVPEESNNNFGNNLIVWDLLFQTYYLPDDNVPGDLGLMVSDFPVDFMGQLKAPFRTDVQNNFLSSK